MKTFIQIFVVINFLATSVLAQSFEWAKRGGSWAFDYGYGICTDNSGNAYVAGKYELTADFDGISVTSQGNHDVFTAKYDANGNIQWVRSGGGVWGDYAHSVTCDASGNVYTTGEFELTSTFDNLQLTTWGSNDIFIAKYDTYGNIQWVKRAGGSESDQGLAISTNGTDVFLTGKYKGTAYFDAVTLISQGDDDIFVASYDASGNLKWATSAGGIGEDEGMGICHDASGNIYVTGYFNGTATFSGTTLTGNGNNDIFIAKYDNGGNLIWVKNAGGAFNDYGTGIAYDDNSGILFITGGFRVNSFWDGISLWANLGDLDIYVAAYNSSGNALWVEKAGSLINDRAEAVAVDNASNVYITGYFADNAVFGSTSLISADNADIFVASYTSSGSLRWVMSVNGVKDSSYVMGTEEAGRGISVDNSGSVLVSGSYRTDAVFGGATLLGYDHTDVFITKINQGITNISNEMDGQNYFVDIYPNPSNGEITLEIINKNKMDDIFLEITDLIGQDVYYKETISGKEYVKNALNLNLPAGVYMLRMKVADINKSEKLIITR